ncbi:hypothetical protein [Embleya hyalina]|uniref:Uncharacterized protein n=1 Tax=Embleya hyalina TaxID=516124 RepID=A0A401YCZ4_9ACTN|nr:hypothetical protein [Embleya hyalina]GCD92460.1 hypothetical protein EHYA_00098 [Embleya hyalina]
MTGRDEPDWDAFLAREVARADDAAGRPGGDLPGAGAGTGAGGGGDRGGTGAGRGGARSGARSPGRVSPGWLAASVVGSVILSVGVYGLIRPADSGPNTADVSVISTARPTLVIRPVTPTAGIPASPPAASTPLQVGRAEAAPPVPETKAFPEARVRLPSGAAFERVDVHVPRTCAEMFAPDLTAAVARGAGCTRLAAALYTDADRRMRISVAVVTMNRAEDAATLFALTGTDPIRYQVVALDPPAGSTLKPIPPGGTGDFGRLMAVRSLVVSSAEWSDGRTDGAKELKDAAAELLKYVQTRVADHEEHVG